MRIAPTPLGETGFIANRNVSMSVSNLRASGVFDLGIESHKRWICDESSQGVGRDGRLVAWEGALLLHGLLLGVSASCCPGGSG